MDVRLLLTLLLLAVVEVVPPLNDMVKYSANRNGLGHILNTYVDTCSNIRFCVLIGMLGIRNTDNHAS